MVNIYEWCLNYRTKHKENSLQTYIFVNVQYNIFVNNYKYSKQHMNHIQHRTTYSVILF
ncbi:hypothetical protein J4Q44_G00111540 [Coregonus suidteri]|uniref:Uncharacterized protein n=1 Tax=Coregonus suidteri TaxID=861788 RepID=A0AAN8LSI6_9TELE